MSPSVDLLVAHRVSNLHGDLVQLVTLVLQRLPYLITLTTLSSCRISSVAFVTRVRCRQPHVSADDSADIFLP